MLIDFWRRGTQVAKPNNSLSEAQVIGDAMKLIQQHIDQEARSRRVSVLPIRDLCPQQKANLVTDLAKLLR